MGEPSRNEGPSTCNWIASYVESGGYCAVRYSANNAWIVNLNNGNWNNNNTVNRYFVCGASESLLDIDEWFIALRNFFSNKHSSIGAQRLYIHPSRVLQIANEIDRGTYKPQPGYRFPLTDPSPREIYAAFCEDRLVHHFVAPFIAHIAEVVHNDNGDISHGNRIGHSAQTGAEQIRNAIQAAESRYKEPFIVKIDVRSFFSSIPRKEAYNALKRYADKVYNGKDKEEKLAVCEKLILHDPTKGCVKLAGEWARVPPRKLLENSPSGCGLPIGNFYSQLTANLYLSYLDTFLRQYGTCPRFVDDKCCIVANKDAARRCIKTARDVLAAIGLEMHPDKIYIQPTHRGLNFCGRTIKGNRIYLSNRTLRRALRAVKDATDAVKMCATVNSYLGLMRHCTEWKNERRLANAVLEKFGRQLYFRRQKGHFVCCIKSAYNPRTIRLKQLNKIIYETCKTNKRCA